MSRKVQINKGAIQDNALKALVKSNLFRHKVERNKKGKGSYNRQQAKNGRTVRLNRPALFWLRQPETRANKMPPHQSLQSVTLYQNKNNEISNSY